MTTVKAPYDAEVEYLGGTGTQWIDTGYVGNSMTTEFDLLACSTSPYNGNRSMIGSRVSTNTRHCWANPPYEGRIQIGYAGTYTNLQSNVSTLEVFRIYTVISSGSIVYHTHNIETGYDASQEYTLQQFQVSSKRLFSNGALSPGLIRVFSLSFSEAGQIGKTMDLIPVRFTNELGQSEGAMYDKVSKQLFRNQGTGSFVIGPDVRMYSTPVMGLYFMRPYVAVHTARDYVQDGLIAMWDGIENAGWGVHDANATTWKDLSENGYDYTIASGSFGADHYVIGGLRCAYCGKMPNDVHTIEIVLKSNYNSNNETIVWATDPSETTPYGRRQCCFGFNGGIGFGYNAGTCPQNKGTVSCFGCTFGTGGAPVATFFNGATYAYSGSRDYFNNTAANKMGINVRYGTFVGEIYSLRLYSRALTAAEIAANYAIDKERFNLP